MSYWMPIVQKSLYSVFVKSLTSFVTNMKFGTFIGYENHAEVDSQKKCGENEPYNGQMASNT